MAALGSSGSVAVVLRRIGKSFASKIIQLCYKIQFILLPKRVAFLWPAHMYLVVPCVSVYPKKSR
ncbi:hypothetical protein RYX36_002041 [Vicia faba]